MDIQQAKEQVRGDVLQPEQQEALREVLLKAQARLHGELRDGADRRANEEQYGNVIGAPGDPGDASVATEQADLRQAQIGRDLSELRQVDAALARMEEGSYGICTHCGQDISPARLEVAPTAERCIVCQTAYERQYADASLPSITSKV